MVGEYFLDGRQLDQYRGYLLQTSSWTTDDGIFYAAVSGDVFVMSAFPLIYLACRTGKSVDFILIMRLGFWFTN